MYYEYIARYTEDILVSSKIPMKIIQCWKIPYPLQGVRLPEYYLDGEFKRQKRDLRETVIVGKKPTFQMYVNE